MTAEHMFVGYKNADETEGRGQVLPLVFGANLRGVVEATTRGEGYIPRKVSARAIGSSSWYDLTEVHDLNFRCLIPRDVEYNHEEVDSFINQRGFVTTFSENFNNLERTERDEIIRGLVKHPDVLRQKLETTDFVYGRMNPRMGEVYAIVAYGNYSIADRFYHGIAQVFFADENNYQSLAEKVYEDYDRVFSRSAFGGSMTKAKDTGISPGVYVFKVDSYKTYVLSGFDLSGESDVVFSKTVDDEKKKEELERARLEKESERAAIENLIKDL